MLLVFAIGQLEAQVTIGGDNVPEAWTLGFGAYWEISIEDVAKMYRVGIKGEAFAPNDKRVNYTSYPPTAGAYTVRCVKSAN